MKPRTKLAESKTPDGGMMALYEHDGAFSIFFNGKELMHSLANSSESQLGSLGVAKLKKGIANRVLIGGLGLGYTLKSVLESVGPETVIEVVELMPEVIEWNRIHLQQLNGSLLEDPRVEIRAADVGGVIRSAEPQTYDVILLDVDNGPVAMVDANNSSLYSRAGLRAICAALKPGGRIAVWSAGEDKQFETRLRKAGLKFDSVPAKVHEEAKRAAYLLYVVEPRLIQKQVPSDAGKSLD